MTIRLGMLPDTCHYLFQTVEMSVESFYDEVVATAVVDFDSPEIQDIISALEELLYRFVNKMTENKETNPGSKVSYIQQCGSIAEKTSLWKSVRRRGKESKFIEFDYLAVMENDGAAFNILEGPCRGCRSVEKDSEQILVSSMNKNYFLDPLYKAITAMCPCTVEHFTNYECLSDISNACLHCKSVSDSGYLQIAKTSDFEHQKIKRSESCSLVFYWTSWTNSLFAPNIETLLQTEKINRLVIRVDFLPAFETKSNSLENASPLTNVKHLIIAKKCRACRNGGWMFSYSMYEVDSILNMKNSHRKCFIIIKFLYSQFIFWADGDQYLKSYYAKVAFLNHCDTCTDIGDSTRCVVDVLQSLLDMYRLKLLKVHISGLELQLPESVIVIEIAAAFMLCFIHILTEMKTYVESKHLKKWCVHGSKGCIAIIKKTVDMLQDGRLWLDTSNGEHLLLLFLAFQKRFL